MPVGRCFSWTADEVLLIFCPPGPLPLRKASVRVSSTDLEMVGRGGRGSRERLGLLVRERWENENRERLLVKGRRRRGSMAMTCFGVEELQGWVSLDYFINVTRDNLEIFERLQCCLSTSDVGR